MKKILFIVYALLIFMPSLPMAEAGDTFSPPKKSPGEGNGTKDASVFTGPAQGTAVPGGLTLRAYVSEVLQVNPDIKSMQAQVAASAAKYHYTGVIPDPTLMLKINNMDSRYSVGSDPMSYFGIELDQMVPFPVKLHLESEIAFKELRISRQELRQKELEVQSKAVAAFSDYYCNDESLLLLEQYLKIIDMVIRTARQRYETGIASQQDLLRAILERSRLEERIDIIGFELKRSTARMNGLLAKTPDTLLPGPAGMQAAGIGYDKDSLYGSAESTSPAIAMANSRVEENKLELSRSKWSYAPDLEFGAGLMTRGSYPPGWTGSIGISLPLYFWTKQRYMVKGAGAGLDAAKQNQNNTEKTTLAEIDASYKEAQTEYSLINLYKNEIVPQAALTFSSAISSYITGRVDFVTTMDALLILIDYRQMLYQRTADYFKALARLSVLSGVDLIKADAPTAPSGRPSSRGGKTGD